MFFPDRPALDLLLRILILGPATLLWVTVTVRLVGLRSFSKMASFDFVATVATGSLLANAATSTKWPDFLQSALSMSAILATQALITWLRRRTRWVRRLLENQPILLMLDGTFDRDAMDRTRVTEADIRAKLREANVKKPSDIRAVVLETTGDLSILHGGPLDSKLLRDARSPESEPESAS